MGPLRETFLGIAAKLPDVALLSLGGGMKIARMQGEVATDLQVIGKHIVPEFEAFAAEHGLSFTWKLSPAPILPRTRAPRAPTVMDIVDTGSDGYTFIKVDAGMTEVLRPSLYGAQHPIVVVPKTAETRGTREYLVARHCCESGDMLTPEPGNPEGLKTRELTEARVGHPLVIEGAGAIVPAWRQSTTTLSRNAPRPC